MSSRVLTSQGQLRKPERAVTAVDIMDLDFRVVDRVLKAAVLVTIIFFGVFLL